MRIKEMKSLDHLLGLGWVKLHKVAEHDWERSNALYHPLTRVLSTQKVSDL